MTRSELLALFREIYGEILEENGSHLNERDALTDINADSYNGVQIVEAIERRLEILIPDEYLVGVRHVYQLLDVLERCDKDRKYWAETRLAVST